MDRLTLDVFWIHFMPIYQHAIGVLTALLTAFVVYLMLTKTPESGRALARYLILMQMSILMVDICWGFLFCPVLLFPLSATLCNGIMCGSELTMHIGLMLIFQCSFQVALAIVLTIHYKYTAIARMANHRRISTCEKVVTRLLYWTMCELPTQQLTLLGLLERDTSLRGVAYSQTRLPWMTPVFAAFVVVCLVTTFGGCAYYIIQIFTILSRKTATLSERTRKLHRTLTNTLLIQLFFPLVTQAGPMAIYVSSVMLFWLTPGAWDLIHGIKSGLAILNAVLCVQLTHSIVQTSFLVLTTPSYRAALSSQTLTHTQNAFNI